MTRMIRKPELTQLTGLSPSSICRMEKAGTFPPRIKLSKNAVAWKSDEVEEWLQNRPRATTSINPQGN